MNRSEVIELLAEYTTDENLLKHAYGVEAAMRAYARKFGENEETWGCLGLIHDFDYQRHPYPEEHALKGAEILEARGFPAEVVHAVRAHAGHAEPQSLMDKALIAVDELVGLIVAVALVKPNKSIDEVSVKSVKKKMKDKAFAKAVDRDQIIQGAEDMGIIVDEHIQLVIDAITSVREDLGI